MKPLLNFIKLLSLNLFTLFSLCAITATTVNASEGKIGTGTIRFTGSIIHTPCSASNNQHSIELSCLNSDRKTQAVNINQMAVKSKSIGLANNRGNAYFNWVNSDDKLGLVIVSYR